MRQNKNMGWFATQRHNRRMYALFPLMDKINRNLEANHPDLWSEVRTTPPSTAMKAIMKHFGIPNDNTLTSYTYGMIRVLGIDAATH